MATTFKEKIALLRLQSKLPKYQLAQALSLRVDQLNECIDQPNHPKRALLEAFFYSPQPIDEAQLQRLLDEVFVAILFLDYAKAASLIDELIALDTDYQRSEYYADYLVTKMALAIHTEDRRINALELYELLEKVAPFDDGFLQELFDIEWAAYCFLKGETSLFTQHLTRKLHSFSDDRIRAFGHYLLGAYYGQNYTRLNDAIASLKVAQHAFENQANYARSNQAKVVLQRLYIYTQNYSEYHKLYQMTFAYAQTQERPIFINYMEETTARAHLIQNELENAFMLLEKKMYESHEKYFLTLYCSYMLQNQTFMMKHFPDIHQHIAPLMHPFLEMGLRWLETYGLEKTPPIKAQKALVKQFNQTVANHDYFFIVLYARWAAAVLKAQRRHKEAFEITQTWMQIEMKVR